MKQILFFALKEDLLCVIDEVEKKAQLTYYRMGNFLEPTVDSFGSAAEIPNLGIANVGSSSVCESYLVSERKTAFVVLPLVGSSGIARYCVDQLNNPDSVTFTPAGLWDNGNILLHGRVGTASNSVQSLALIKLFSSVIKKKFRKVKAFYVGPKAFGLLESGKRLTIAEQSPREFDLVID
ncbi:hypothetical protein [Dechloromonas denitrificans]|uniref:hypothetical protein n=1 Tax=Dechloromonas denitrificans TaxID=281362 RepID=UPI001CF827BE|nr:hypothetical protein [Dechloromonas denitrificans]UCV03336.1 hypothetical protein KI611_20095 [Dechloromonas denitrificans]